MQKSNVRVSSRGLRKPAHSRAAPQRKAKPGKITKHVKLGLLKRRRLARATAGHAPVNLPSNLFRKVIGLLRGMENPQSPRVWLKGKSDAPMTRATLRGEKALLNGRRLAGDGGSQSVVDALLA